MHRFKTSVQSMVIPLHSNEVNSPQNTKMIATIASWSLKLDVPQTILIVCFCWFPLLSLSKMWLLNISGRKSILCFRRPQKGHLDIMIMNLDCSSKHLVTCWQYLVSSCTDNLCLWVHCWFLLFSMECSHIRYKEFSGYGANGKKLTGHLRSN